jgi:TM2 domain-containing membrane protein YozV
MSWRCACLTVTKFFTTLGVQTTTHKALGMHFKVMIMIGKIDSFNPDTQTGVIKSEDQLYSFHLDDWQADVPLDVGDDVNFEVVDTSAKDVNLVGAYLEKPKAVKSKYIAAALALVFGFAGIHRVYLGYYKIAAFQLAFTLATAGYGVLWGFIEFILLLAGHIDKDAKGRPLK